MIDVHSHILYGIDDGAKNLDESLRMLDEAGRAGIKTIITTPHLKTDKTPAALVQERIKELSTHAAGMGITLLPGYEVYLTPSIPKLVANGERITLAQSDKILIELPFSTLPPFGLETLYQLELTGMTPVIAHPERNICFLRKYETFAQYAYRDCLIQLDAASIIGKNGWKSKNFCKRVIKDRMAHFVGSDAHTAKHYKEWYIRAYKQVCKWGGEEYASLLFQGNAASLLLAAPEQVAAGAEYA